MSNEPLKPFKKIDDQITTLKERNLLFGDEEAATRDLARYGYYEIINGYKDNFMIDPSDDSKGFRPGTTFEHIFQLFRMDSRLRTVVMESIELFESELRQRLAYVVSERISWRQDIYLDRRKYKTGEKKWNSRKRRMTYPVDDLMDVLKSIINKRTQPYRHYREDNHNIPPWIIVKGLSFGNLIWWARLLKGPEKTKLISSMYGNPEPIIESSSEIPEMFGTTLELYLDYRNLAAHGGRIYNHISEQHALPYNTVLHRFLQVSEADYRNGKGQSKFWVFLKSTLVLEDKTPMKNLIQKSMDALVGYLVLFPNDLDYLCQEMELDKVATDGLKGELARLLTQNNPKQNK